MASDEYGERRRRRRRRRRSSSERAYEDERHGEDGLQDGEQRERQPLPERPTISLRSLIISVVSLVAAVALIGGGYWYYRSVTSPAALALAELRTQPLVGLVIADEPSVVARLKDAINEEARNPTPAGQGATRPQLVIAQLRQQFIAPAMRTADDAHLLAAMKARAALVEHLRATNTAACREFSYGGIRNVDSLDPKGQALFKSLLTAMEAAYRDGHAHKDRKYPLLTLQHMGVLLTEAGYRKPDFDKLNAFASLSNDVSCDTQLKLDQAVSKLPPDKQGIFSRYILGN